MSADIALPWIPNSNPIPNRYPQSCMSVSLMGDLLSIMRAQFADWFAINAIPERDTHRLQYMHIIALTDPRPTQTISIAIHLSIYLSFDRWIVPNVCNIGWDPRLFGTGCLRRVSARPSRRAHKLNFSTHISDLAKYFFFSSFWWLCSVLRAAKNKSWKLLRKVNMMVSFSQFLYTLTQDNHRGVLIMGIYINQINYNCL